MFQKFHFRSWCPPQAGNHSVSGLLVLAVFLLVGASTGASAQVLAPPALPPEQKAPSHSEEAVAFLKKLEEKYDDTESLSASFEQTRIDAIFGDEVKSEGRFWQVGDKFRADYESENDSVVWMVDGKLINYVPAIKQVEMAELPEGEEAPINQMLLGFGVKVGQIRDLFDLSLAPVQPKGKIAIQFDSRDLDRSLQFQTITITFDRDEMTPEVLVAEDESSIIRVELKKIRLNEKIDPDLFEPEWPEDTDVVDYSDRS